MHRRAREGKEQEQGCAEPLLSRTQTRQPLFWIGRQRDSAGSTRPGAPPRTRIRGPGTHARSRQYYHMILKKTKLKKEVCHRNTDTRTRPHHRPEARAGRTLPTHELQRRQQLLRQRGRHLAHVACDVVAELAQPRNQVRGERGRLQLGRHLRQTGGGLGRQGGGSTARAGPAARGLGRRARALTSSKCNSMRLRSSSRRSLVRLTA